MFQKFQNIMNRKKKKDEGAAIVMVIVALAFIGMLVAMVIYMSYYNYQMKAVDKESKNNFYSAETALELVNAGIQKDINNAMGKAYVLTTQLSSDRSTAEMNSIFRRLFRIEFSSTIDSTYDIDATTNYWDIDHIRNYINDDDMLSLASAQGKPGVWIDAAQGANTNILLTKDNEYMLQNVKISYLDNRGFVSIITTDIRVAVPSYDFALSTTGLSLENYSIIANDCFVNDSTAATSLAEDTDAAVGIYSGMTFGGLDTKVTGNVFGGNDGVFVKDQAGLSFVDDTSDTVEEYNLTASSLNVENSKNGLNVDGKHKNYLYDIKVNAAGKLDVAGDTLVRDDLDIFGKNAVVKLSGTYKGFGDSASDADKSSSILINGANADIDFSKLTELKLCGNAFVAATHYDADVRRFASVYGAQNAARDYIENVQEYNKALEDSSNTFVPDENTISKNSADVIMGESVAVKANQLMYMVPSDCVGFLNGEANKQVIAKNPMTYDEYIKLTTTYKEGTDKVKENLVYKLYDLSALSDRMESNYNVGVQQVFRRVNGNVLVYLYLKFQSQLEASRFFQDYIRVNPESYEAYIKSYVKSFKWNPNLEANNQALLTLAGNSFKLDGNGKPVVVKENLNSNDNKLQDLYANVPLYNDRTEAMMHMLTTNIEDVNGTQLMQSVYDNIVDVSAITNDSQLANKVFTYGDLKAMTVKGDYRYNKNDATKEDGKIKVLVATGNVYLDSDFDGLVISGKSIYVGFKCNDITYNASDVYSVLRNATVDGHKAYEIFGNLGKMTYAGPELETEAGEAIKTSQYITYANWKKE